MVTLAKLLCLPSCPAARACSHGRVRRGAELHVASVQGADARYGGLAVPNAAHIDATGSCHRRNPSAV